VRAPHVVGCQGGAGSRFETGIERGPRETSAMKPNTAARVAAIILAIAGLSAIVAAGLIATRNYRVTVGGRQFKCGSVLVAKDPRNLVSRRVQIPVRYKRAYSRCQQKSSDLTHKAITFLIVGVIPLLFVLMLPALSRRSRRTRAHRRSRL
jgi:hypothetical protein